MLLDKSISELSQLIHSKRASSQEIVSEAYDSIENNANDTNAFITIVPKDIALSQAQKKDALTNPSKSPLSGLPFVIKDSYVTKDIKTTCASNVLNDYLPQYNATVFQKLIESGAILVGKTNMDSWGHGASGENTDFKPVKNPYNLKYAAGGSTAGSAVANACRNSSFAIGEDTGGSIRLPASWTNTSGLKVTYGRVSRYGCIAYASSFDTVGPMAKSVQDLSFILHAIAGKDPYDATSSPHKVDNYPQLIDQSIKDITLGVPYSAFGKNLDNEITIAIESAISTFKTLGVKVKSIKLANLDHALASYTLISRSETSSNLGRYDGIRYGRDRKYFTQETNRRIMEGTYSLSTGYYDAYYRQSQKVRTLVVQEYENAFKKCDCLLFPVTPTPPTKLGDVISDPLTNILYDYYNCTQNPAGVPSLAFPAGFSSNQLPIGIQITGPMFSEGLLLSLGHHYQLATDWHLTKPQLVN